MEEIIAKIKSSSPPINMVTRIIAIDGPGGAGKSVLAERIAKALGGAEVIHTDDFFDPILRSNWWRRFFSEVVEPVSKNKSSRYQKYDWDTKELSDWFPVQPADFIVIEGVQSSRKSLREYIAFNIWVQTPREERLRRGLERDGEAARDEWAIWMAHEDKYIRDEQPEISADIVVDGTDLDLLN